MMMINIHIQLFLTFMNQILSPDVIASQLDISQIDVVNTLRNIQLDNKIKKNQW